MSVRKVKRRDPRTEKVSEYWMIDVEYKTMTGEFRRIRRKSPDQTKSGALRYERSVRRELEDIEFGRKERKREGEKEGVRRKEGEKEGRREGEKEGRGEGDKEGRMESRMDGSIGRRKE